MKLPWSPRSSRNVAASNISVIFVRTSNLTMVSCQCINAMTVRSTFDRHERKWDKEAVIYFNVPTETHTTCFSPHHDSFDGQPYWRHPDAFLLAPTRSEITPLHGLRVCLGSAECLAPESGGQQTLCASALRYKGRMEAVKADTSLPQYKTHMRDEPHASGT